MKKILINKLHQYIRENNPDVLIQLEEDGVVTEYLINKIGTVDALLKHVDKGQPAYIVEDACMEVLTQDLKPSKYNYISNLLEEEFENYHLQLKESGTLQFETINLINYCHSTFEDLVFNEKNENNRFLRYAISGCISEYLESNKVGVKNVSDGLQQPAKITGQY
jgi:hypothetical protein